MDVFCPKGPSRRPPGLALHLYLGSGPALSQLADTLAARQHSLDFRHPRSRSFRDGEDNTLRISKCVFYRESNLETSVN